MTVDIDIITIFPDYFEPLKQSLVGKAIDKGIIRVGIHDLRNYAHDIHRSVDDTPYGGGPGMVMKPTVWGEALDSIIPEGGEEPLLIMPTPAGQVFNQTMAEELSQERHLVFACGRYEGVDARVTTDARRRMRVLDISLGDYVLIGGEVAVLAIVEASVRLMPGVLGNKRSYEEDSFSDGLLEGPCYTRPPSWRGLDVPEVLLSGNHARIDRWHRDQALKQTARYRPDLLADLELSSRDWEFLQQRFEH